MAALDHTLSRQSAQVDIELESNFTDVLDEEVTRLGFVVSDLAEVELVGTQTERDVRRLSMDWHIVVGTTVHAHNSHAVVGKAIACVKSELNILRLVWLEDSTDR